MRAKNWNCACRQWSGMLFFGLILALFSGAGCRHTSPPSAARPEKANSLQDQTFPVGVLKPVDSKIKVAVGEPAPDFELPSVDGGRVSLKQFRGKKDVLLSFVPAAWTPVCSSQWPLYNALARSFQKDNIQILGITVDNIPTLFAWNQAMGRLWFPILSDFYPHGKVASRYGVLRGDGMCERALILVDKQGIIRFIDVHDINEQPPIEDLMAALNKLVEAEK